MHDICSARESAETLLLKMEAREEDIVGKMALLDALEEPESHPRGRVPSRAAVNQSAVDALKQIQSAVSETKRTRKTVNGKTYQIDEEFIGPAADYGPEKDPIISD